MGLKNLIFKRRVSVSAALCAAAALVAALSFDCAAQAGKRQKPARVVSSSSPPRVGTIKDYPATGLMTGCGNFYSYFAHQAKMPGAEYVFISSGDGRNTWMNLDGRDVRLKLIKSPKPNNYPYRSYYRWGKVSIVALFENYKRKDQPSKEDDPTTQVTITLRRGRGRVRTVRAVGEADC